jgi:hypothetical protein
MKIYNIPGRWKRALLGSNRSGMKFPYFLDNVLSLFLRVRKAIRDIKYGKITKRKSPFHAEPIQIKGSYEMRIIRILKISILFFILISPNKTLCVHRGLNEGVVILSPEENPKDYQAYLTWKDYDGLLIPFDKAIFIWNGNEIGKDIKGMQNLLAEIDKLEQKSKILVFPNYTFDGVRAHRSIFPRSHPFEFGKMEDLFWDKIKNKEIALLYSSRDNNGNILEESIKPLIAEAKRISYGQEKDKHILIAASNKQNKYDAYFTWKDYDGQGDPKKTLFLWNGKEIGKGDEGLGALIAEIEKMPEKSKILVFPTYVFELESQLKPKTLQDANSKRKHPYDSLMDAQAFWDKIVKKNISLIYSYKDNMGNVLLESIKPLLNLIKPET